MESLFAIRLQGIFSAMYYRVAVGIFMTAKFCHHQGKLGRATWLEGIWVLFTDQTRSHWEGQRQVLCLNLSSTYRFNRPKGFNGNPGPRV